MKRIAVLASGSGSNFEALAEAFPGQVSILVCDRPGAMVVERASRLGITVWVHSPREFADKQAYEEAILKIVGTVDLICLAGYMRLIGPTLQAAYGDRMINIHPSLLPLYKGAHAIRDAFEDGRGQYGVTIHRVTPELDGGEILAQRRVVYDGRDIDALEAKIHDVEHSLYIETVKKLLHETSTDQCKR